MKKFNVDGAKVLSLVVTGLGVAGTILSNVVHKNEQDKMKEDIVKDVMKKLQEKQD